MEKKYTYQEWQKQVDKSDCNDKIVKINGKKYQLTEV